MGSFFHSVFLPIIYPMEFTFNFFWKITNSAGLSIILLALFISILTIPFKIWARGIEDNFFALKTLVDCEVVEKTTGLTGEERFNVVERIYQSHNYHPIKSIMAGTSFIVIIPFLISAIFIFSEAEFLKGVSFLFISDLSAEDRLFLSFNVLPIAMLLLGTAEALLRWRGQQEQIARYLITAIVLFFLVYSFASALIIYWISMNICTSIIFYMSSKLP